MAHDYSATYTNNPAGNDVDFVRLTIGDTNCAAAVVKLSDDEIQMRLDEESSRERAAWRSCEDVVSFLTAQSSDFGAGTQRESHSQTLAHYRQLANDLKTRGSSEFAAMRAGGLSLDEKEDRLAEEDRVQPQFRTNRFRNERAGGVDSGTFEHRHG